MKKDKNSPSPEEKIQQENELLKLKLTAEQGAQFFSNEEQKLDPAMENEWLNYIQNFEKIHRNAGKAPVYKFVGEPAFLPEAKLDDASISKELDRLLAHMGENGVSLSCICDYDDRVIYKFVTEELFEYEVDDVHMEGMVTNFIYEEFYPNHDYDLRSYAEEFLGNLLKKKWSKYDDANLCRTLEDANGREIPADTFVDQIKMFQEAWDKLEMTKEEITSVSFDLEKEKAEVTIDLVYSAFSPQGEEVSFTGKAMLRFRYEYGYWYICLVKIPGFAG